MSSHVFISYVSEDRAIVDRLRQELDAAGIKTWIHDEAISPGEVWRRKIRKAIQDGDFFVACFSAASVRRLRSGMNEELMVAIGELRERSADRAWFIPVKLTECEIPDWDITRTLNLTDLQYVTLWPDWEKGIARLIAALKGGGAQPLVSPIAAPPPKTRRRSRSRRTLLLAIATVLAIAAYARLLSVFWPVAFPQHETTTTEQPPEPGDDSDAIDLVSEALVHIKANRISDAHQSIVSAGEVAKTRAVKDRIAALRLVLAISLSEAHQMMGEALAKGRDGAAERDKTRYAELAIQQSMQSFKWARKTAEAMDILSVRALPQVQFSKIELSNPLSGPSQEGMRVNRKIEAGNGVPSDRDVDAVLTMLSAQAFRFYVSKALHAEGGRVEVMTRDLWSGRLSWSADLIVAIHGHLTKMADKGAKMAAATLAQPPPNRFSVGRSFGLGQELDFAFCRSILESLRRFLERVQSNATAGSDRAQLTALLQDVDRRQLQIAQSSGGSR